MAAKPEEGIDYGPLTEADVEMMRWATTVRVEEIEFAEFFLDEDDD